MELQRRQPQGGGRGVTAKQRLVPPAEVEKHILLLRSLGVEIGAVDIRADGVTVTPRQQPIGNDYDRWLSQDAHRDPAPRRS